MSIFVICGFDCVLFRDDSVFCVFDIDITSIECMPFCAMFDVECNVRIRFIWIEYPQC